MPGSQFITSALNKLEYRSARNKHMRVLSDNRTTVCYINNIDDGSKSKACSIIAKKIWQFALE